MTGSEMVSREHKLSLARSKHTTHAHSRRVMHYQDHLLCMYSPKFSQLLHFLLFLKSL